MGTLGFDVEFFFAIVNPSNMLLFPLSFDEIARGYCVWLEVRHIDMSFNYSLNTKGKNTLINNAMFP